MKAASTYQEHEAGFEEELVHRYAPLVKRIAYHLLARLSGLAQVEDLIQVGMIGLLDAVRNYDPAQGASFETYATIRIRGAMLDEARRGDWAPRSVHRRARQAAEAIRAIESATGREARDHEVAEALDLTLTEYQQLLQDSKGARLLSLDEMSATDETFADRLSSPQPDPSEILQAQQLTDRVAQMIGNLPERERLVLSLYYDEELNLREIGAVMGVSESRISQIHTQALLRLQARMRAGADR